MLETREKRVRLKDARLKKGLTQKETALKLRTSRVYYTMIENGTRDPGYKLINRISDFFGLDVRDWR